MERINRVTGDVVTHTPHFQSRLKTIVRRDTISEQYLEMSEEMIENMARFQREGSNWSFSRIIAMDIHLNRYEPGSAVPLTSHYPTIYRES